MGDASRRVPLRHRQGAVRQEDPTGADLRGGPVGCVDQRVGEGLDCAHSRPQSLWWVLTPLYVKTVVVARQVTSLRAVRERWSSI